MKRVKFLGEKTFIATHNRFRVKETWSLHPNLYCPFCRGIKIWFRSTGVVYANTDHFCIGCGVTFTTCKVPNINLRNKERQRALQKYKQLSFSEFLEKKKREGQT